MNGEPWTATPNCTCAYRMDRDEHGHPTHEVRIPQEGCPYHDPKIYPDETNRAGRREAARIARRNRRTA